MTSGNSAATRATRIDEFFSRRPPRNTEAVYIAVIISLLVHVFALVVSWLMISAPDKDAEAMPGSENEVEIELVEMEIPEPSPEEQSMMSEEVRNLIASADAPRTRERVNYTGKSQAQIDAEVRAELAAREQQQRDALSQDNQSYTPSTPKDQKAQSSQRDNYDHVFNQSDKSTEGKVAATFSLKGRKPVNGQPKPTYRCQTSGKIVVNIEVDATGAVTNATIDEARSVGSACLREDSIKYARKWKFDYSSTKKQSGTITFEFASQ